MSLEHERFRNEQDKKKLLIIDLNDLRFQQEEAKLAELKREKKRNPDGSLISTEEDDQDDPVTLKIALRTCRRDLTEAQKRLTKIEADYSLVVPLRDFEALEKKCKGLESRNESLENDLKTLKNEQGYAELFLILIRHVEEIYSKTFFYKVNLENIVETWRYVFKNCNKSSK